MPSPIFAAAAAEWREMRDAFELVVLAALAAAEAELGGHLLSRDGVAAGVDPLDLFTGPLARAGRYASADLHGWWAVHPRPSLAAFEEQWVAARGSGS